VERVIAEDSTGLADFADNAAAVHLYENTGWSRIGGEVMIDPRSERPSYTFGIPLG
jgi:hypothetical protein